MKDFKRIDPETKKVFYVRICPKCKEEVRHKAKSIFYSSRKKGTICRSCASKEKAEQLRSDYQKWLDKTPDARKGENNGFFGKKHSQEFIDHLSKTRKGQNFSPDTQFKKGNATMSGKSVYSIWVKKHGKKEADKKMLALKRKQSENSSGKNNPMYGKPSPTGSGNGWSGWYKGWYFRSLRELSYMINVIERFDLSWESGEKKKWKIRYVNWEGRERNYFPDFIIEGKYMVECKPKKLWTSADVTSKSKAAETFCKNNSLIYKMRSPKIISKKEIKDLYLRGEIKWTERYEEKYRKYYQ